MEMCVVVRDNGDVCRSERGNGDVCCERQWRCVLK